MKAYDRGGGEGGKEGTRRGGGGGEARGNMSSRGNVYLWKGQLAIHPRFSAQGERRTYLLFLPRWSY